MVVTSGFRVGCGDALVEAWVRSVHHDPVSDDRFRRMVLLDPNFDPEGLRIAWDKDDIVGAAYAVRRQVAAAGADLERDRGWIPFFFVLPRYRGAGVGRQLLSEALDWLRGNDRSEVDFASYTPHYFVPGLDRAGYPHAAQLLESLGFSTLYSAVAMDRNIVNHTIPEAVSKRFQSLQDKGFSFSSPTADELVPLMRLAGDDFNPDWARAIREAVVGGVPRNRIIVARNRQQDVIGWAMCGAYDAVVDRFGPFGVSAECRGLGIGEVLLHLCLQRMRGLGAHNAWFLWTDASSAAGKLYHKTGFTDTRVFDVMRAQLTSESA